MHNGERHRGELIVKLLAELAVEGGLWCQFSGLVEGILIVGIAAEGKKVVVM